MTENKPISSSPAVLTRAREESLKPSLSVCYKGGSAFLGRTGLSDYQKREIDNRMQSVWNKAVKLFKTEGNSTFRVDITDLYASYTDPTTGEEVIRDLSQGLSEKDLQTEILELSSLVKGCYRNIRESRGVQNPSNRPHEASKAFQSFDRAYEISERSAIGRMRDLLGSSRYPGRDLSDVSSVDGFIRQYPGLAPLQNQERIRKGEELSETLGKKVSELVKKEESLLKDAVQKSDPAVSIMRKDLERLRSLEGRIRKRNRFALYCALGLADAGKQKGSLKDRLQDANAVSDAVYKELLPSMDKAKEPLAVYSKEVGDLILHDRMEYMQRVSEDNPLVPRGFTGPSIEEFLTHILLAGSVEDAGRQVRSLGFAFGNDLQESLENILKSLSF